MTPKIRLNIVGHGRQAILENVIKKISCNFLVRTLQFFFIIVVSKQAVETKSIMSCSTRDIPHRGTYICCESNILKMRVYKKYDPITYRICTVYFLLDRKTFGFYGSFTTTLSTNTHHPCLSHAVTSLLLILNRPKRIDLRKKGRKKKKIHQFLIV